MTPRTQLPWRLFPTLMALLLLAGACSRPPILVQRYILEYPAPASPSGALAEAVKVHQFAAAEAINTTAMLYRPDAYQRQAYVYHQWRITPGPLVTDSLVRDLRHAGLFRAVFTEDSPDRARFRVEGGVTEMQEENHPAGWQAVLGLTVTLLDTNYPPREVSRRVMFQKSYRAVEAMPDKTPQGLAAAMSRAMSRLSQEIIQDIHRAAATRLAEKGS